MKRQASYRERTMNLETIRFALSKGYQPREFNERAVRHFRFVYNGAGSPDIEVSWYAGSNGACITIGDTTTIGSVDTEAADRHALASLKRYW